MRTTDGPIPAVRRGSGRTAPPVDPNSDDPDHRGAPLDRRADTAPETARQRGVLITFVATSFLAATLLFLVQPMVTKMLLPLLGGTADVWNTAMVFFQAVLLAGYSFAHISLERLGARRQTVVQIVMLLLPLLVLPIAVPDGWRPRGASPIPWTLLALAVMVGLPFFALSTVSPTIQRWFASTDHPRAHDPYFLYAASNIGSLLALLSYPIIVEPALGISGQTTMWAVVYGLFVLCAARCAWLTRRHPARVTAEVPGGETSATATASAPIGARTAARWIFLAAIPSALMLGVTRHLSTDVASMPLLWVIPLSLYLITFILAFGRPPDPLVRKAGRALKLLAIPLALTFFGLVGSLWLTFGLHLGVFTCAALVAHGRLSSERPPAERLTTFYVLLSVGGVVGGIVTALIAPVVFDSVLEYPLTIVLALTVLPAGIFALAPAGAPPPGERGERSERGGSGRTAVLAGSVVALAGASVLIRATGTQQALTLSILVAAVVGAGGYVLARRPVSYALVIGVLLLVATLVPANPTIFQERTFFGVHRVYEDENAGNRHVLVNGATVHGMEDFVGPHAGEPTTYYHRSGPIGQFLQSTNRGAPPRQVGLIGLGSGALATYGRAGDRYTYYEIDQAVIDIARDPRLFTFVSASQAEISYEVGDGRLLLEEEPDARYDVLVVDAFSGDAIPMHLITTEALALYQERLADRGVIAFHISNRYFDFAPVLGRLAAERGLVAYLQDDPATPAQGDEGKLQATWVVMARSPADLPTVANDGRWQLLPSDPGAPLWTDAYSDLLHVLRWQG